jgi:hypothetical protein
MEQTTRDRIAKNIAAEPHYQRCLPVAGRLGAVRLWIGWWRGGLGPPSCVH